MIRLLPLALAPALALFTASCGCKKPLDVPSLRDAPEFGPLKGCESNTLQEAAQEPVIENEPVVTPVK